MIIVNFSHPLDDAQLEQIARAASVAAADLEVRQYQATLDDSAELAPQVREIVDTVGLSPTDWQTRELLIVLPSYAPIVAALLAHLHGLIGHFPTVVRLRPERSNSVTRFVLAELVSLDDVRSGARRLRAAPAASSPSVGLQRE